MSAERAAKRARVLALLGELGLDGLLLSAPGNVAWYTGGARTHVLQAVDGGIADLLVTPQEDVVFTDAIEARRLGEEELGDLEAELRVRPWYRPRLEALPLGPRIGSDAGLPGCADVAAALARARAALEPAELARYRRLGADAAAALTAVAHEVEPGDSEHEAAARLAAGLLARGIDPVVLLVGGVRRLAVHRHPLPTGERLGARAMLVAVGRRHGLMAALTRIVAFAPLAPGEEEAYRRLLAVEAAFLGATRPGRRLGDVFADGAAAYGEHGFAPDEWHRHHQGGPIGYFGRDEIATPQSDSPVADSQAYAWNPSAPGLKVEDTVVVSSGGFEVLTADDAWPATHVAGLRRPLVLER